MFQDIMDELQFFPLVFNFDICGFDMYGTLVVRINRIYRGLPVLVRNLVRLNHVAVSTFKQDKVTMISLIEH
jgi:hypothetical protein